MPHGRTRESPTNEHRNLILLEAWIVGAMSIELPDRIREYPALWAKLHFDFERGIVVARMMLLRDAGIRIPSLRPDIARAIRNGRASARNRRIERALKFVAAPPVPPEATAAFWKTAEKKVLGPAIQFAPAVEMTQ
jgi:hypothetical protein